MFRKSGIWAAAALIALLGALPVTAQEAAEAEASLDEVIAMNLEARGGADAIEKVESARFSGSITFGPGMEAPFTMEWKRPDMVRMEIEMQGQAMITSYDGKIGWSLMPMMGQTEPEQMPDDQIQMLKEQSDFVEGPLYNHQEKGHNVEYLGIQEVEGTETHHLRVMRAGGTTSDLYLDAESGIEIKSHGKTSMGGQEVEMDTLYGDYKEVAGIMWPHSMEMRPAGAPSGMMTTISTIEVNVDIEDERFKMPAKEDGAEQ